MKFQIRKLRTKHGYSPDVYGLYYDGVFKLGASFAECVFMMNLWIDNKCIFYRAKNIRVRIDTSRWVATHGTNG